MGRTRAVGWMALAFLVGMAVSEPTDNRSSVKGNSNASGKPQDDIVDFIPYQGVRYNRFDWGLLKNMASKQSHGNLLFSPISLKLALVLLYEGAQDETAQELATVMSLPVGMTATRDRFSGVLKSLQQKGKGYQLNMGTRVYVDDSVMFRQRYASIAKEFYSADVVNANFSNSKTTAEDINKFVSNVTEGHIPQLFASGDALKDNLMLIVNTLFFKGSWHKQPFMAKYTQNDVFRTPDNKTVQVPYMRANAEFYMAYVNELDAKIIRIPYAGKKYSMFIVLPQRGTLAELIENKISPYHINRYMWLMQKASIDLKLPKFKFQCTSHLENTLRELGIRDIFDDTATLTGILRSKTTSRRLVVNDIVQKSGIEVNEEGSTAYVATEIEIGMKINDETFHATQPFLFYIEEEDTGTIVYMGVVNNPLEENAMAEAAAAAAAPAQNLATKPDPNELLSKISAHAAAPETPVSAVGPEMGRYNYFNIELLQKLNEEPQGNNLIGTSSIKSALMILAEAAAGDTRQQILSSLRIANYNSELRKAARLSVGQYKDLKGLTELKSAIKIWLAKDVALRKNYTDVLKTYYRGELEAVNFNDVSATIKAVNDWITKQTNGRINTLADPGALGASTKMLLTTSVYFKGKWLNGFDKANTRKRCFDVPNVGCSDVMMMETIGNFKYEFVHDLDAQAILLPYTGERMGMLILLPRAAGAGPLADLSRDIAFTPIPFILSNLQQTEVLVQMPRFSINNKINMKDQLSKLGIRDLFSDEANLSKAFPDNKVKVGGFMHTAQIEVNEEGTVAAAVSEAVIMPLIGSTRSTFRADRPFLFFLLDLQSNDILFAGRYYKPDEKTNVPAPEAKPK